MSDIFEQIFVEIRRAQERHPDAKGFHVHASPEAVRELKIAIDRYGIVTPGDQILCLRVFGCPVTVDRRVIPGYVRLEELEDQP
jgi:hypothetical protein